MQLRTFSFITVLSLALTVVGDAHADAASLGAMPSCGVGDTVVWENTSSKTKAYHVRGDRFFGNTKHGAYACQSDAIKAGYHAAKMREGHTGAARATSDGTADTMPAATPVGAASPMPGSMASPMTSGKHHRKHKRGSTTSAPERAET